MRTFIARFFYSWDGDSCHYPFEVTFEWDVAKRGEPTLHENVEGVYEACLGWSPTELCPVSDTGFINCIPHKPAPNVPCPVHKSFTEDEIEEIERHEDLVIGLGYIRDYILCP